MKNFIKTKVTMFMNVIILEEGMKNDKIYSCNTDQFSFGQGFPASLHTINSVTVS